jgi:CPA1 family monovalent cation:H+ antiporter
MTFGVVLVSILLQGLSMAPLLRRLGLIGAREEREAYELARGELRATTAALGALEKMTRDKFAHPEVLAGLRTEYESRAREAERGISDLHLERLQLRTEELHAARRQLLLVEKDQLLDSHQRGAIGREAYERLASNVDARLVALEEGDHDPEEPRETVLRTTAPGRHQGAAAAPEARDASGSGAEASTRQADEARDAGD